MEDRRLAQLAALQILDTTAEREFDNIVETAALVCGAPMATLTFVDHSRQWHKARKGVHGSESPREIAFCDHTIRSRIPLAVVDALEDERFRTNPLVLGAPHIRAYLGAPLIYNDQALGTVCVIDTVARNWSETDVAAMQHLAELCLSMFDLRVSRAESRRQAESLAVLVPQQAALITELESANHVAAEALAASEAAARTKAAFLANMSHELRTPLNGIVGVASALRQEELTVQHHDMLDLISTSALSLDRILSDVLDYTKLSIGQISLECAPMDVRETIKGSCELFRNAAEQKGLRFTVTVDPEVPEIVRGDSLRLRQVITNLVSNAFKFTERGSIAIHVSAVASTLADGPLNLCIEVADTGIGLSEEAAGRVFDRFEQADTSITRRYGGTGLGLSISRDLAQLMGGMVDVQSQDGVGSCFSVRLPFSPEDFVCEMPRSDSFAANPRGPDAIGPIHVLVVDDHPTNRAVAQMILAPLGATCALAENGQQALEAWAAEPFDLILMDLQMPVMDGLTAISEIRRREGETGRQRTPIAVLSANLARDHAKLGAQAGADAYIEKPLTLESLALGISCALDPDGTTPMTKAA